MKKLVFPGPFNQRIGTPQHLVRHGKPHQCSRAMSLCRQQIKKHASAQVQAGRAVNHFQWG